jgi:hypothetical protein
MKPNSFPMLPMSPKSFWSNSLLVAVRALVLSRCATQGVHEAAGNAKNELALLALSACTKTVSIRCGNQ